MNQEKIGSFISTLRKEKQLTQEQLGEKLGVSQKSISRWETKKYVSFWQQRILSAGYTSKAYPFREHS